MLAQLSRYVVLPPKLGPVCRPAQHGTLGWHARITAHRFQGLGLHQPVTDDVGQLGHVGGLWAKLRVTTEMITPTLLKVPLSARTARCGMRARSSAGTEAVTWSSQRDSRLLVASLLRQCRTVTSQLRQATWAALRPNDSPGGSISALHERQSHLDLRFTMRRLCSRPAAAEEGWFSFKGFPLSSDEAAA